MSELIEPKAANETSTTITVEEALKLAMSLHQANKYEEAEALYRKLLEVTPEDANVLHFFGMLRHQRGFHEEGHIWVKKALEIDPNYIDAQNNLGNIYLQTGHPDLAEPCFRRVIELNPSFVPAYANLGVALKELDRFPEAIDCLQKAISLEPNDAYFYQNLGNILLNMKRYSDAVAAFRRALELKPFDPEAYAKLSRTFYIMGELELCIEVLEQWLAHDANNPLATHMYAAYTSNNAPLRASDEYLRQTFDGFAASFDGVLKRLEYKAPLLVQKAVEHLGPDSESWRLLDAGCGTGLSGAMLRPLVKYMVGVDLSGKMLERAKAREVYDDLFESEITAYFAQNITGFDVITSVDTLCYFGDLSPVAQSAVKALKPKGWFIMTLEKLDEEPAQEGFKLNIHGRYSHSEAYVRQVFTKAGFRIVKLDTAELRRERSDYVAGLVITAQLI